MARSERFRISTLVISNILIPIALLIFASGFFPYKPFFPGLATFEDEREGILQEREAVFDRVIFMVVDALRSDFVYGYNSGFEFTQSLIRSGAAIPFTAHATPPTVTMPRVKALTTGSVPSFLDLILNFAESDTTSSLANQDTWLAQIKAKGGKLVFYGDDTWLKLFPGEFFARSDGTSSFFVSDFTEVDNNVTRHVPGELARDDWSAMIMHYLGLDHIGHKTGPNGPNMLPKQREMDGIVRDVYEAMGMHQHHTKTLLVLAGDHGMNAGGNHGGSGPGETEPALLFMGPRFKTMERLKSYECPTAPKEGTEFHYYTKVEQSDIVPVLAGLMDMPISKNNLGVFIPELAGVWSREANLQHLHRNSEQMLQVIKAKYGDERFDQEASQYMQLLSASEVLSSTPSEVEQKLAWTWGKILYDLHNKSDLSDPAGTEQDYFQFLHLAQEALSNTASSYDIPKMVTGMIIAAIALMISLLSFRSLWPPTCVGIFFTLSCALYGVMMFASSYVEEEQHFWYWLTPVWITFLAARGLMSETNNTQRMNIAVAGAVLLLSHRSAVRWTQTGQKHAGDPDIAHTVFPEHHILMWILILATFVSNSVFLHLKTFSGIFMTELAVFTEVSLTFLAIIFKLNFTHADAPELVKGLAVRIRAYSAHFSLVEQAKAVFGLLAIATIAASVLATRRARRVASLHADQMDVQVTLPERLHHLLTLFLIIQTRAPNIPLFLMLEIQRLCLSRLTLKRDPKSSCWHPPATEVATSVLLFSNVFYFCMGGSNSISSIDLSNAYNGVADYNVAAVGILLFASNWAGPIWWCSAAVLLMLPRRQTADEDVKKQEIDDREWVMVERSKLHEEAVTATRPTKNKPGVQKPSSGASWMDYTATMTAFICSSLLAVMATCTALRTHLFIWTVFSPKYLYAMAWSIGWHLIVNIGLGTLLFQLRVIA